jgi:cytochrome b pre-mRNA-processing protein 3
MRTGFTFDKRFQYELALAGASSPTLPAQRESALFAKAKTPGIRTGLLARFATKPRDRDRLLPLYQAIVAAGRDPVWYREGQVPDTVAGRFDMIAAILAIVLIRFEAEPGDDARHDSVYLTETFVADMDESLHQIGVGDYHVGKHVGRMMSALGGRIAAFRQAASDGDYAGPVRRNIFHDAPPSEVTLASVAARFTRFAEAVRAMPAEPLAAGRLPTP